MAPSRSASSARARSSIWFEPRRRGIRSAGVIDRGQVHLGRREPVNPSRAGHGRRPPCILLLPHDQVPFHSRGHVCERRDSRPCAGIARRCRCGDAGRPAGRSADLLDPVRGPRAGAGAEGLEQHPFQRRQPLRPQERDRRRRAADPPGGLSNIDIEARLEGDGTVGLTYVFREQQLLAEVQVGATGSSPISSCGPPACGRKGSPRTTS